MSASYATRYDAVFICTHPKEPKISEDQTPNKCMDKS